LAANARVDRRDRVKGATPLVRACQEGHAEIVGQLLAAKAAVNMAKWSGKGPLWSACWKGHIETAKMLLQHGACPDEKDDEVMTTLSYHLPFVPTLLFIASSSSTFSLNSLMSGLDRTPCSELIWTPRGSGAPPRAQGRYKCTHAQWKDFSEQGIFRVRFRVKVRVRVRSSGVRIPTRKALYDLQLWLGLGLELCHYLDAHRINPNPNPNRKPKPISMHGSLQNDMYMYCQASWRGHLEVVRLLTGAKVELHALDEKRPEPVPNPNPNPKPNPISKAELDALDGKRARAITRACRAGHIQVAKRLVESGCDITACEKSWGTEEV